MFQGTNQNMITLLVNVLEHRESRTASRFTSSIPRILTTLNDTQNETRQIGHYIYTQTCILTDVV
jgi:hypothetical protein